MKRRTDEEARADDARLRLAGEWPPSGVRVVRRWIAHGLPCLLLSYPAGFRCNGYVWVPPGHPDVDELHGYDRVTVDVHDGLTFAKPDLGGMWFGFDTGRVDDYDPRIDSDGQRWTADDVAAETERLAAQLAARWDVGE